jgi:hypothetical protein
MPSICWGTEVEAFNPFTATWEEVMALPEPYAPFGPLHRWAMAQEINCERLRLEKSPIDGVARCVRAGLVTPDWLAQAFLRQYDEILNCRVGTWEEAFGPAHPTGVHLSTLRLRRMYWLRVHKLFTGPKKLPRTLAGRQQAAELLGITEKQVRTLLPKKRSNVRGHKPYEPTQATELNANNPFGLTKAKVPKS